MEILARRGGRCSTNSSTYRVINPLYPFEGLPPYRSAVSRKAHRYSASALELLLEPDETRNCGCPGKYACSLRELGNIKSQIDLPTITRPEGQGRAIRRCGSAALPPTASSAYRR